ncbi:hypothetical protein ACVXHA_22470 [Escherichia coli]
MLVSDFALLWPESDRAYSRGRAKPENGVFWESAGEGEYTVALSPRRLWYSKLPCILREGEYEFLDDWRVRSIISKYSDDIALP